MASRMILYVGSAPGEEWQNCSCLLLVILEGRSVQVWPRRSRCSLKGPAPLPASSQQILAHHLVRCKTGGACSWGRVCRGHRWELPQLMPILISLLSEARINTHHHPSWRCWLMPGLANPRAFSMVGRGWIRHRSEVFSALLDGALPRRKRFQYAECTPSPSHCDQQHANKRWQGIASKPRRPLWRLQESCTCLMQSLDLCSTLRFCSTQACTFLDFGSTSRSHSVQGPGAQVKLGPRSPSLGMAIAPAVAKATQATMHWMLRSRLTLPSHAYQPSGHPSMHPSRLARAASPALGSYQGPLLKRMGISAPRTAPRRHPASGRSLRNLQRLSRPECHSEPSGGLSRLRRAWDGIHGRLARSAWRWMGTMVLAPAQMQLPMMDTSLS